MLERLVIAGSGGQGVILAGRLLASAAVSTVPHVTFFPAYGAEVRGGTSNCQIVLSSDEIASPVPERFDSMILMNQASFDNFFARLEPNGIAVVNTSLCCVPDDSRIVSVEATGQAEKIGDLRAANFIMLGAYVGSRRGIPDSDVEGTIAKAFSSKGPRLAELNVEAFRNGLSI